MDISQIFVQISPILEKCGQFQQKMHVPTIWADGALCLPMLKFLQQCGQIERFVCPYLSSWGGGLTAHFECEFLVRGLATVQLTCTHSQFWQKIIFRGEGGGGTR